MTQNAMILKHLKTSNISPMEALELYGCFRLASRINDLRQDGLDIETIMTTRNGKTFASYKLSQAPIEE